MTQKQKIKEYLNRYGSITPLEALRDLGVMRLAARIGEISREGYPVVKEMASSPNRDGKTVYYARYRRAT